MSATASSSVHSGGKRKAAAPIDATEASAPSDKKAKDAGNEKLQEFPDKLTMKQASEVLVACMDHVQLLALVMAGHARHKTLQLTKKRHAELAAGATLTAADVLRTLKSDATGHAQKRWDTFAPAKANPFTQKVDERANAVRALANAKAAATRAATASARSYPDPKTLHNKIFVCVSHTGRSATRMMRVVGFGEKMAILSRIYYPAGTVSTNADTTHACVDMAALHADGTNLVPLTKVRSGVNVSGAVVYQESDGILRFSLHGDLYDEDDYTSSHAHVQRTQAIHRAVGTALGETRLYDLIADMAADGMRTFSWISD
jgi:hypothetical protein